MVALSSPRRHKRNKKNKRKNVGVIEDNSVVSQSTFLQRPRDLCQAIRFNQTVTKRGCIPVVIPNKFCLGKCASFYVPSEDLLAYNRNNTSIFQDCRQCIPRRYQRVRIPMYCPQRRRKHRTKKFRKISEEADFYVLFGNNGVSHVLILNKPISRLAANVDFEAASC
ncbi:DAN domain family member 5-like [Hydractinia symbiolongicarpus]|uniref:DAN domain family member 5-like n=1 Tax=Hydractinia symbiolongicarpus TaxID=13093 RepID=UPI00254E3727|nr:DAN domain family member 5-like [Hydractinia symbiolongicarpus]